MSKWIKAAMPHLPKIPLVLLRPTQRTTTFPRAFAVWTDLPSPLDGPRYLLIRMTLEEARKHLEPGRRIVELAPVNEDRKQ